MSHERCDFCHGRGWITTSNEDGMVSGREDCPGPFVRLAAPPSEALNTDRLARALPGAFRQMLAGQKGVTLRADDPAVDRRWAIAIAAEYALQSKEPTE